MTGRRRRAPSRGNVLLSLLALLLVVSGGLVAAVVSYQQHHAGPKLGTSGRPATTTTPSASPAPVARTTAPAAWAVTPSPAAGALSAATRLPAGEKPTASGLATMLAPRLADPAFAGGAVSIVVGDPLSGATLLNNGGSEVMPASTAKLAVATAALERLGPQHRLTTRTALTADGRLVLVGGGDPTLAGPKAVGHADPGFPEPARLADLAARTASALKARGITHVQLGYDDSLFTGPSTAPDWKPTYITEGDVAPVSALEVDEGQPDLTKPARANDPSAVAASEFAALLAADRINVDGAPQRAAAGDAPTLASVESPPVAALVERMLGRSDNDLAEALARQVAIAVGRPASFTGGAQAVRDVVSKLGVAADGLEMVDGSGLSRSDRVRPVALLQIVNLLLSPAHPELSAAVQGLPVAGFSGTLAGRYASPPALSASGLVRAKTGTLDGVVALAGFAYDASGRVLSFAVVANGIANNATSKAEAALDRVSAGLAGCGCS